MEAYTIDQVIAKMKPDEMAIQLNYNTDSLERNLSKSGTILFYDENDDYVLKFKHSRKDVAFCYSFDKDDVEPVKYHITKRDF